MRAGRLAPTPISWPISEERPCDVTAAAVPHRPDTCRCRLCQSPATSRSESSSTHACEPHAVRMIIVNYGGYCAISTCITATIARYIFCVDNLCNTYLCSRFISSRYECILTEVFVVDTAPGCLIILYNIRTELALGKCVS